MVMTPASFRAIRQHLGLSTAHMARVLLVGSGRTVRRWEAGERPVPGPVATLMALLENVRAARIILGVSEPPPPG